jgi:hypothetical protein
MSACCSRAFKRSTTHPFFPDLQLPPCTAPNLLIQDKLLTLDKDEVADLLLMLLCSDSSQGDERR